MTSPTRLGALPDGWEHLQAPSRSGAATTPHRYRTRRGELVTTAEVATMQQNEDEPGPNPTIEADREFLESLGLDVDKIKAKSAMVRRREALGHG